MKCDWSVQYHMELCGVILDSTCVPALRSKIKHFMCSRGPEHRSGVAGRGGRGLCTVQLYC